MTQDDTEPFIFIPAVLSSNVDTSGVPKGATGS